MELRIRSARVPRDLFPEGEVRLNLGEPGSRKELRAMEDARDTLRTLATRGQWDILRQIKDKRATWQEVLRIATHSGLDSVHLELRRPVDTPRLGEAVDRFISQVRHPKTANRYRVGLGHLYLLDDLDEATPLDEIGQHRINELIGLMRGEYAENTIGASKIAWSAFFTWALSEDRSRAQATKRRRLLEDHPVRGSQMVPQEVTRERFLTPEEAERLLNTCADQMRAHYATLLYTGLRIGELMHLRPQDVDLDRCVVKIRPQVDWAPKGWPRVKRGRGDVPIHRKKLFPLLEGYAAEWAGEDRWFFLNPQTGRGWTYTTFKKYFRRDVEAAGLVFGARKNGTPIPEGVTFHTFRHTLASWLAQRDVSVVKIAKILRDTPQVVLDRYAHLMPSDIDDTINEVL